MKKTKLGAVLGRAFNQIRPGGFKQPESTFYVGAHKSLGAGEGTVHVALSREMQYGARLVTIEQPIEKRWVADVALLEMVGGKPLDGNQVLQIAGIRELVEIDYRSAYEREPVENEIRPNKAGSAGHENGRRVVEHSLSLTKYAWAGLPESNRGTAPGLGDVGAALHGVVDWQRLIADLALRTSDRQNLARTILDGPFHRVSDVHR